MPSAAVKPKETLRRTLCEELVKLRAKHAAVYAREKEIKSALTREAGKTGENFQEVFPGIGKVKVSAPKDKYCKGTAPEIVIESFLALPERERERLAEKGVVVIAEQWSGSYYGSVTVDLF